MENEMKKLLFSYELVHNMFVTMCKSDIMSNSTMLTLVLFVAFVCVMNGIDCLLDGRVGLSIFNIVLVVVNTVNAFSCIRRIRKTNRDMREEQALYDEISCSDDE